MKYVTVLTEYERGWGSKDFHAISYDTLEEAEKHAEEINSKNTSKYVPDYYIVASVHELDNTAAERIVNRFK